MRTQAVHRCRAATLGSGAAVALHYYPGPLEVSAAPRSLLREREWHFQRPWGPTDRREAWRFGGAQLRFENSGGG